MKRLHDLAPYSWITENTDPFNEKQHKDGVFVSKCIPKCYPAYCKLFHSIFEDLSVTDRTLTWNDVAGQENIAALAQALPHAEQEIRHTLSKSILTSAKPKLPFAGRRIRWRELAERYHLTFHPEIEYNSFTRNFPGKSWPRYLVGPTEGSLDNDMCDRLAGLLKPFTGTQKCYFHYDLISTRRHESDLLYEARLEDVIQTYDLDEVYGSPTHWWPEDRGWVVCTDWDLTFTLIGGPPQLIEILIRDSDLECIQVNLSSRVDWSGDRINP
jgi:hypothetical protein